MSELNYALAEEAAANVLADFLRQRLVQRIPVVNPGAGAEWTRKVPAGVWWELLAVQATFTTSAAVANRAPQLRITDENGRDSYRITNASQQAAGGAIPVLWAVGLGAQITNFSTYNPLPTPAPIALPNETIQSTVGAIDVADQWSGIMLTVREWTLDAIRSAADWVDRHYA